MASGHLSRLRCLISRFPNNSKLRHAQTCLVPAVHKSSSSSSGPSLDASSCNVEIGVTSDGKTIVCYHPSGDIPYELTQPIERPDPLSAPPETQDQVLKAHLSREVLGNKQGPTIEELSKMFFTTKHRWYPVGQYHMRRRKKDPPKDR
ncbi:large ribosomal subunit protein mL42 [Myripristis murdjan]|uniref:Large ribosomal subunit protein mL42 n=1 Tax=Myripristis murdjan TaxID=586833 RepID=A0A667WTH5_9TELE|nr:39S ribosomal protein L42, mitochondrial [Myripristis murdjan]